MENKRTFFQHYRAKALGVKTAYVISDLPFYEKLGFETVQLYMFYRKASSSEE